MKIFLVVLFCFLIFLEGSPLLAKEALPVAGAATEAITVDAAGAFEIAREAFAGGDYQRAQRYAGHAFQRAPASNRYANLYGWSLLKLGRFDDALSVYQQAEALDAGAVETVQFGAWLAWFRRDLATAQARFQWERAWVEGHRHKDAFRRGRYKRADYTFIGSIAADANYGLGLLALDRGDTAAGLTFLRRATASAAYPGHRDVLLALADLQARQGDSDGAAATLQTVWDEYGALSAAPALIRTYLLSQEPLRAVPVAVALAAQAPDQPYYPLVQALGLAAAGREADADQALARALALSPEALPVPELVTLVVGASPAASRWLAGAGVRFYRRADFVSARILLFPQAAAGDCPSKLMAAWSNLYAGYPLLALGWFQDAAALRCAPREEALLGQGEAELALGHSDAADRLFVRAIAINRAYVRARLARAAVRFVRKDYAGAVRAYLGHASALPPSQPGWSWGSEALSNLGWAHYFTGKYQAAAATFQRLDRYHQGREFAAPKAGLGWALLRQGQPAAARGWFEQALRLAPHYVLAEQGLAALPPVIPAPAGDFVGPR
ncbi:MAG: tetratricopeptide repeat protein [Rhodospirillaceae bacterium]